jgi:LPXTG-site transpeptidase (sortase) family protein
MTQTDLGDVDIAEPQPVSGAAAPQPDPVEPKPEFSARALYDEIAQQTRRRLTKLLAIGVVLVAAWWLCSTVVSDTWYHARQRQLATEFTEAQPHLVVGKTAAVLQIPRIGMNVEVVEGAGPAELRSGPGHVPASPLPGRKGNSVVVGHHSAWGGPFGDLDQVHKGDVIFVKVRPRKRGAPAIFGYTVTKTATVKSDNDRLFGSSKDFRLTLATSTGGLVGGDRFVVVAVSGTPSKAALGPVHGTAPPTGDLLDPVATGIALVAFSAAWFLAAALRRRKRGPVAMVIVLTPVLLAGVLAAYLQLDRFLSPLR